MTTDAPDALSDADLEQIQALVFRGWSEYPYAAFHFVRLSDSAPRARAWLREVEAEIAWADGDSPERILGLDARVQLALTTRGMRRLGLPWSTVKRFPYEAKAGMERRAQVLGDKVDADYDIVDHQGVDDHTWLENEKPQPTEWGQSGGLDLRPQRERPPALDHGQSPARRGPRRRRDGTAQQRVDAPRALRLRRRRVAAGHPRPAPPCHRRSDGA